MVEIRFKIGFLGFGLNSCISVPVVVGMENGGGVA